MLIAVVADKNPVFNAMRRNHLGFSATDKRRRKIRKFPFP